MRRPPDRETGNPRQDGRRVEEETPPGQMRREPRPVFNLLNTCRSWVYRVFGCIPSILGNKNNPRQTTTKPARGVGDLPECPRIDFNRVVNIKHRPNG
jgi:hypothetical protein